MGRRRFWARIVAWSFLGSLLATFAFGGATLQTPLSIILRQTAVGFVYATCCIAVANLAMPWLAPGARRRLWFPLNWVAVGLALVAAAFVACAIAVVVLAAVGHIEVRQMAAAWKAAVKSASYFTLTFGMLGTVIAELQGQLNRTTLEMRTRERDEAEARRLAAEAQLASLESRVDPHFFFNTLNSIAALVREDPAAAERVIEQLASVMRASLDAGGSPLVPLEQEIAFVRNYLEIERVRFGNRLQYTMSIDEAAARTLVPRLALQTLVENAVKYAVSPGRAGANLRISAAAHQARIRVEVEDDGPGFDGTMPAGHGLALLAARMKMQFGQNATIGVDTRPGRTCVRLDLPPVAHPGATAAGRSTPVREAS